MTACLAAVGGALASHHMNSDSVCERDDQDQLTRIAGRMTMEGGS